MIRGQYHNNNNNKDVYRFVVATVNKKTLSSVIIVQMFI